MLSYLASENFLKAPPVIQGVNMISMRLALSSQTFTKSLTTGVLFATADVSVSMTAVNLFPDLFLFH